MHLIYQDPVSGKDLRGLAQIIIAKHRSGATEDVDLKFRGQYTQFLNEEDDIDPMEVYGSRANTAPIASQPIMSAPMPPAMPDNYDPFAGLQDDYIPPMGGGGTVPF